MKPVLTREEARAMDRAAVDVLGLPSLLLMENAGRGATDRLLASGLPLHAPVVVGGVGQNGGDAWVIARHLLLAGLRPRCVLVDSTDRAPTGDAAVMYAALERMGCAVTRVSGAEASWPHFAGASVIVDGLFGTGLTRDVVGAEAGAVEAMLASRTPVVSLDLPSGIDADTGGVRGIAPRAVLTLTFGATKRGLVTGAGRAHAGRVEVVGIGAPPPTAPGCEALEDADVAARFAPRAASTHKSSAGRVLVFGGASGTTGAALLAARGAHRIGAGLVTVAVRPEARAAYDARVLETMTTTYATVDEALALADRASVVVMGPGFGLEESQMELVDRLVRRCVRPMVVDADALTHLAAQHGPLVGAVAPRVLTPHAGEAARLLRCTPEVVEADRFAALDELVRITGQYALLKGPGTLIGSPHGRRRACLPGGAELATGGSGDVLAGALAGALAAPGHGDDLLDAVASVVHLHALAGRIAAHGLDRGLLAGDLADALPAALAAIRPPVA